MRLEILKPFAALNKAYRKQGLNLDQITLFKENLRVLFDRINDDESEEKLKNIVSDFLKDTYYKGKHEINTKGRQDLVIHHEKTSASEVGVIIEVKRPANKSEMLSEQKPNAKAMHELLHYYLQERYLKNNKEIKNLIVTNIYEWYVFDGADFERFFFENKQLTKRYKEWNDGLLGLNKTDWFYQEIAKPFFEGLPQLDCAYFNLKEFEGIIKNGGNADDNKLIDLYKIFSPEHLLKQPFANDSNMLNKGFYDELLHIMGLEETKDTGKKLIERKEGNLRNEGSLLENAINILKTRDKLSAFENRQEFGETEEEQLFSLGLELCITWLNRILFLKLLEGQIVKYRKGDKSAAFLNDDKINGFEELNELFFEVLAVPADKRTKAVAEKFAGLPYLNSSLFEESELENRSLLVADLKSRLEMPVSRDTVLKDESGKKITGKKKTLRYLFEFLDAYNFESDGTAEIQAQNKTIINASVLGLIFEKINGYKDGSFFTPAFITMFMGRETLRQAAVQKFNEKYGWDCGSFVDLFNKMDKISISEANETINGLKICDPAVGSGHFLVSALNEIVSIKNDLEILADSDGKRLRGYQISIENDELIITKEEKIFVYDYKDQESRRVQETLFHEKQTIIENCLFGVDINPKSVMICRLRLWIELLKNTYYTERSRYTELETLPNIDINIKTGNSLIFRFDIKDRQAKLPAAVQQKMRLITQKYKEQVVIYKNTSDKATKKQAEKSIKELQEAFSQTGDPNDADYKKWKEAEAKLGETPLMFAKDDREAWKARAEMLAAQAAALQAVYAQKLKTLYGNAFEWRFMFPEVLGEDGDFAGFDAVIGNPPYIRQEKIAARHKEFYLSAFKDVGMATADIYVYFFGLALQLAKPNGLVCFITLNKWMKTKYGNNLRRFLAGLEVPYIIDFFELPVFKEASTDSAIVLIKQCAPLSATKYFPIKNLKGLDLSDTVKKSGFLGVEKGLEEWKFVNDGGIPILEKLNTGTVSLKEFTEEKMYRGVVTGANEVFVIDNALKEKICKKDMRSAEIMRPYANPTEFTPYKITGQQEWFINAHNGVLVSKKDWKSLATEKDGKSYMPVNGTPIEVFRKEESGKHNFRLNRIDVEKDYPAVYGYFLGHKEKLINRGDKGEHWTNLRNCDYVYQFDETKIIYVYTAKKHGFYFDTERKMINNSSYMIVTDSRYLWAYLNSKLFLWLKKIKFVAYGDADEGGRVKLDLNKMETVPVKPATAEQEAAFNEKVAALLALKQTNPDTDVTGQEKELDKMIYEVYGITPAEQETIERQAR